MATFKSNTQLAPLASQLLHPSGVSLQPRSLRPPLLADVAAGLAASVDPDIEVAAQAALITTASYDAVVDRVDPDGCRLVSGAGNQPVALAVVSGQVLAWTAADGVHALSAGGSCGAVASERLQVVNFGAEPAIVVVVRALGHTPTGGSDRDHPLRSLVN
jgi:hypothetical protein